MGLEYSDESEYDLNKIDNPIWIRNQARHTSKLKHMVCCGIYFYYWPQMRSHRYKVHGLVTVD